MSLPLPTVLIIATVTFFLVLVVNLWLWCDAQRFQHFADVKKPVKRSWPSWEPWLSSAHDDRCECPGCSGLCQDDYEFYSGSGQYAEDEGESRA